MTNDSANGTPDETPTQAYSQMPAASHATDDETAMQPEPVSMTKAEQTQHDTLWPPPGGPTEPAAAGPAPGGPAPSVPVAQPPWAARYGLVRPINGRWLAGVCAAFARATNTDPVLWRVIAVVLGLFWGVGLLAYIVAWLLIPAEGDTASPIEALFGRGRSRTNSVVTAIVGVGAIIAFFAVMSGGFRPAVLGALVVLGAAFLLTRNSPRRLAAAGTAVPEPNPGYREPFAPHGPYAGTATIPPPSYPSAADPVTATYPSTPGYPPLEYPVPPAFPPPPHGPETATAPKPPRPKRPPSRLGRLTLSVAALVIGLLAVIDLAGANVRPSAYVATALAAVGAGLVVGAWFGRARYLIPIGAVLVIALAITSAGDRFNDRPTRNVVWAPTTVASLSPTYRVEGGNAVLDLSKVDFNNSTAHVDASANFGNLEIILPPQVDTDVSASINLGNAEVFGDEWGGVGQQRHQVADNGSDGPGGGQLSITADVNLGNLEVHR
jgi:phage shock protein PspC (stress-responsive transcriptional regulator)